MKGTTTDRKEQYLYRRKTLCTIYCKRQDVEVFNSAPNKRNNAAFPKKLHPHLMLRGVCKHLITASPPIPPSETSPVDYFTRRLSGSERISHIKPVCDCHSNEAF